MTLLQTVCSLALLGAVAALPASVPDNAGHKAGKNWLAPHASLVSSVIPSDDTASVIPRKAGTVLPTCFQELRTFQILEFTTSRHQSDRIARLLT